MERFGFNQDPELDYPDSQMAPSGVYNEGELLDADDAIDIGRVAIGQERLLATPLQMAEVAATVAQPGRADASRHSCSRSPTPTGARSRSSTRTSSRR